MVTDWGARFREKALQEALSLPWVVGGGRNRVSDVVAGTTLLLRTLYEGEYHEAMRAAPRPFCNGLEPAGPATESSSGGLGGSGLEPGHFDIATVDMCKSLQHSGGHAQSC